MVPGRHLDRLARADGAVVLLTFGSTRSVVRVSDCRRGNNSVVECDLAKVEVAGSNPVSRSNLRPPSGEFQFNELPSSEGCPP